MLYCVLITNEQRLYSTTAVNPEPSEEERNVKHLIMLADREFGDVPLYWDKSTNLFNEMRM